VGTGPALTFIKAACADNTELRRRLENLLSAAQGADQFFEERRRAKA